MSLSDLLEPLPDACKDLRLNLQTVLRGSNVDGATTRIVALSAAYFCGEHRLAEALLAEPGEPLTDDDLADAQAAAALMGMTTIYYRARHLIGKPVYEEMRPSLRMNRMLTPGSRIKYESCALACAALGGCEACLKSHEAKLLETGATEAYVHDLLRIASVVHGVCVALSTVDSGS